MASPGVVNFAVVASIFTTGGAVYYFLSEGGDSEKLDANVKKTRETLDANVKKTRETLDANVKKTRDKLDHLKLPNLENILPKSTEAVAAQGNPAEQGDTQQEVASKLTQQTQSENSEHPNRQPGAWCHTCSGPRIWFFAEKFRLKRRFTPYPDPPHD